MIAPPDRTPFPRQRPAAAFHRDPAGLWADIPAFTAFSQAVYESLSEGALHYSQRQALLKQAHHLGIRKFDANLIIAMVQNRAGQSARTAGPAERRPSVLPLVVMFVLVQSVILAGAWMLLRS